MEVAIVMPVFNEETFLEQSLKSLVTQTYPIKELIIVNDGSTDNSLSIATNFAQQYSFISVISSNDVSQHAPGQKVIHAFERGFSALSCSWELICKFDADIVFPENYIESLVNAFSNDVNLGIYGGVLYVKNKGVYEFEAISLTTHVRGPVKAYRKSCFTVIGGLRPALGWDTLDELLAMYHNFKVQTDNNLVVKHMRPTGSMYEAPLAREKGKVFYALGYDLILGILASIKWAQNHPGNLSAVMGGFLGAWFNRSARLVSVNEAQFIRKYRWKMIYRRLTS